MYPFIGTRTCFWWKCGDGFCHLWDCNWWHCVNFWHISSYIQGLTWYAKRLRVDEDGDVAEQFLDEVLPEMPTSTTDNHKPFPRFQINNRNRPAKVENQVILQEGKLQQCIEHKGRLLLVWREKGLRNDPFSKWWCIYEEHLSHFDDNKTSLRVQNLASTISKGSTLEALVITWFFLKCHKLYCWSLNRPTDGVEIKRNTEMGTNTLTIWIWNLKVLFNLSLFLFSSSSLVIGLHLWSLLCISCLNRLFDIFLV